jgi:large subunit ribosomal protein LP1
MTATTARLSNDHAPLRVITKHTPVPFLLEAFPIPPSHIPPSPSPALSPISTNPPPSQPPTSPLPPVPGPSSLTEGDTLLLIQSARRSSSIRSVSSSSTDPQSPTARTRQRNGSISSLRSFQSATQGTLARNPSYDLVNTISEEGPYHVHPPESAPLPAYSTTHRDIPDSLKPSFPFPQVNDSIACIDISDLNPLKSDHESDDPLSSFPYPPSSPKHIPLKTPRKSSRASELHFAFPPTCEKERERSVSPDVTAIIHATPRPRSRPRSRVSSQSRPRISSLPGQQSRPSLKHKSSGASKRIGRELEVEVEDEDDRDSDSSIDLHTPLP